MEEIDPSFYERFPAFRKGRKKIPVSWVMLCCCDDDHYKVEFFNNQHHLDFLDKSKGQCYATITYYSDGTSEYSYRETWD